MNMYFRSGSALALCSPFLLAACGGSTTNGPVANSAVQVAGCTTTKETCNDVLQGVVAKLDSDPDTGALSIRFITLQGNDAETGALYNDGQHSKEFIAVGNPLVSEDGKEFEYEWVGNYTSMIDAEVGDGDDPFVRVGGFYGRHTDADAIRTSGEALYLGGAEFLTMVSEDQGTSFLGVDFQAGEADLVAYFDGFADERFDEVHVLGMTIDGFTFTGDSVEIYKVDPDETQIVNITGANTTSAAAGMFFGPVDVNGSPLEYGAMVLVDGDDDLLAVRAFGEVLPEVEPDT